MTTYILHTSIPCQAAIEQALKQSGEQRLVCLGLDIELHTPCAAIIIAGGKALNLGKHPRETWLSLVRWLRQRGCEVHALQEACGFGWKFHEQLVAAGAKSLVAAPQEIGGKRKTDSRDARTLAQLLWDYIKLGNRQCLRPVRVPTRSEQERRGYSRHRAQMQGKRAQLEAQGRSLMWDHGWLKVPQGWWKRSVWAKLKSELQAAQETWLVQMLGPMQTLCEQLQARADELEKQAVAQSKAHNERPQASVKTAGNNAKEPEASGKQSQSPAPGILPKGFGELSYEIISAEVIEWSRFKNRGQAGSFIGCCPSERSSGGRQKLGEIDRIGSARIRTLLVEAAWRLLRHNPGWRGFKKFGDVLQSKTIAKASGAKRRKAIVACARLLMIDLWRLHTGHATLEGLGLKPAMS